MTLSCYCDSDMDWWHYGCDDYSTLVAKRGRRCVSCKRWIKPGATVARFERARISASDIEWRIYGDEVPMPPLFMCEGCADLYFSLDELGFCISLGGKSMRELVKEYADVYGRRAA